MANKNAKDENRRGQKKKNELIDKDANSMSKKRSLPVRAFFKIIKIVFIWIPVSIISIVIIALLSIKLYLSPGRVESLIINNFKNMSYGSISLKVKEFSPYGELEFNKILIRNGEEFGRTKFVEIEKLAIRYGLFSMLIGNIRVEEIGIYKPRIYLKEKNGEWNAAKLMKPGVKKPPEEEEKIIEEKKEEGPPAKEINLPISVEFLFKFILDDLRLYVNGTSFTSSIKGLACNIDIRVPPFKRLPLSIDAVTLLDTMKIELNPKGVMDIAFSSKEAGIKTPLILNWKLVFNKKNINKSVFDSVLKFGTYNAPVRFQKSHLTPLNLLVSYDLFYNPLDDRLKISHFGVKFKNKKWLYLSGDIKKVTSTKEIYLRMTDSNIVLDDLYPYFFNLTKDRKTKFSGVISLYPLIIDGNPSYMDIKGELNLKNIFFKNPEIETSIPNFKFTYLIKKRIDDMKISSTLKIPHLLATLGRDKLGDNAFGMKLNVSTFNNFQRVRINNFSFNVYSPNTKKSAFNMAVTGVVKLKPDKSGNINITKLTFLKDHLSEGIKNKFLQGVPFKKPVDLNLNARFALGREKIKADLGMLIKIPDYNIHDLKLSANVLQDNKKKRVTLRWFKIGTRTMGLSVNANGTIDLKKSPFSDSDLKLVVKLDSPEMKPIYGPWELSGLLQLAANLKGDIKTGKAFGSIKINNFFVKNEETKLAVDDMNLDFPFEYFFASMPVESRISVDKSQIIDNENFKERENFSIKSIKTKHPARDMQFTFVKDFAATMFFKNNAFELEKMKMYVLDGAVYGRDILFYLADMPKTRNFKNVEYRLILDVTNVDIGQLDNPDPAAKTRDAELSLNANFTGRGLNMFMGKGKDRGKQLNVKGYININKLGEEFARKLFEGLSKNKGESTLGGTQYIVDNSMNIKGFNYNLDIGLMYTKVSFDRKAIGRAIAVEDIEFNRMPIQKYLNNILGRQ